MRSPAHTQRRRPSTGGDHRECVASTQDQPSTALKIATRTAALPHTLSSQHCTADDLVSTYRAPQLAFFLSQAMYSGMPACARCSLGRCRPRNFLPQCQIQVYFPSFSKNFRRCAARHISHEIFEHLDGLCLAIRRFAAHFARSPVRASRTLASDSDWSDSPGCVRRPFRQPEKLRRRARHPDSASAFFGRQAT